MTTKSIHFLLVEDDDAHAHLMLRNMRKSMFSQSVDHVHDGAEALAYLRGEGAYQDKNQPDLVLLDLHLPKVDGLEVLSLMKQDAALCEIPVVVLTTSDTDEDRDAAYRHQANSYVVKPMSFDNFQKLVNDLGLCSGS